ncbi:MAG: family 16 glycosylhydrolase [Granulosicoccus sp.]
MINHKLITLPPILLAACVLLSSAALAIETPRDLRGTEVRQNTVKWEWRPVSGAVRYDVTVNGQPQGSTSESKFYSYDLAVGEHLMSVVAVGESGDVSDRTLQAQISVSTRFKYGTHGRSTLVSAAADVRARSSSSDSFDIPQNPRGTEYRANDVLWEWDSVPGAVEYEVTVDGLYAGNTEGTSWKSKGLWSGTHSMTVKAINSFGELTEQSDTVKIQVTGSASASAESGTTTSSSRSSASSSSEDFSVVQGLTAVEFADNDVRWGWNPVSGAEEYEVTVDGKVAGITDDTQWVSEDLWVGSHSLTVKAIDDSGQKTERSKTLKIKVTGNAIDDSESSGSDDTELASSDDEQEPAPPPPQQNSGGGDENASRVESLIDPASYDYSEVNNKSGYKLVFSDEFNGTALNPYRWHSQLRWDGEWNGERYEYRLINGEDQFYVNILSPDPEHQKDIVPVYNPFKFDGNTLSIKATVNPLNDRERRRTHGKLDDIVHQQPFLSGAISTHEKFAQKYGYFEASIKIPSHEGTFPAFWLFHEKRAWEGTQRTEIDIMENLGHAPHYVYNSFHYFKNVTRTYGGDANFIKPKPSGQIYTGIDYSQNFHVYAVEWSPGKITWFIDGEKVSELKEKEADFEELYVMINLAMGGNWTNFPKNAGGLGRPRSERFPTSKDIRDFKDPELEIDYVRVYKRK